MAGYGPALQDCEGTAGAARASHEGRMPDPLPCVPECSGLDADDSVRCALSAGCPLRSPASRPHHAPPPPPPHHACGAIDGGWMPVGPWLGVPRLRKRYFCTPSITHTRSWLKISERIVSTPVVRPAISSLTVRLQYSVSPAYTGARKRLLCSMNALSDSSTIWGNRPAPAAVCIST